VQRKNIPSPCGAGPREDSKFSAIRLGLNVSLRSSLFISFIFLRAMANPNTTTSEIQEINNRILQKENEIKEKEEQVLRLLEVITEIQGDWQNLIYLLFIICTDETLVLRLE
jgi:hypothetical protein